MVRILIVDDQKVVREKIRYMLAQADDLKVVGCANNGQMALEQIEILQPDIVLIDVEMPNLSGIETTKIISRKFPEIKVLVLSTFDSEEYVNKTIQAGAKGYLLKSLSELELHNSIRFIAQGYTQLIGPGLQKQPLASDMSATSTTNSFSSPTGNAQFNGINSTKANFDELHPQEQDNNLPPTKSVTSSLIASNDSWKLSKPKKVKWKQWLSGWALVNICVWTLTILYAKSKPPVYISEWSLILPGEAKVDLNLPSGKAEFNVDTSIENLDPRNNILYLATSPAVLNTAAQSIKIAPDDFGEPEIELVDDSSIITFNIEGESAEEARAKGFAIHNSMLKQIDILQTERARKQTEDFRNGIESDRNKLETLQQSLTQRKIGSDLVAPEKVTLLANRVEELRQQQSDVRRELQESNNTIQMLSTSLELNPQQANDALKLQGDSLFQEYLQQYSSLKANLVALQSRFTDNSPAVFNEQEKLQQVESALIDRGTYVLKKTLDTQSLEQLNLKTFSESKDKASMARELIAAVTLQNNLEIRNQSLDKQIQELNTRIENLAQEKLPLENLEQEADFAKAILSSKIAQSGIQEDSSNFPVIQLLSEPDLPEKASNSTLTASVMSATAFSLLSLIGLILLLSEKKTVWNDDLINTSS